MYFLSLLPFLPLTLAGPVHRRASSQARIIYKFPTGNFIENVAMRSNGHLLLSVTNHASIYDFDPASNSSAPTLVAKMPGVNCTTGITEIGPDLFAVAGGNITGYKILSGSARLFYLNVKAQKASVALAKPELPGLNGITSLPSSPRTILGADSVAGTIVRINTLTGKVDVVIKDKALAPTNKSNNVPLGVNGLKVGADGYLYYTNSARGTFGRVKITKEGDKDGKIQEILRTYGSSKTQGYDDFTLDGKGSAYVTLPSHNVEKIGVNGGKMETVVGGELLKSPSAAVMSKDGKKVYIVTLGNTTTLDPPGQIAELNVS